MELELIRPLSGKKETYTIGKLYIDGKLFCDTLEDRDRGLKSTMSKDEIEKIKVKGTTAIPTGRYKVTLNVISPKFSQAKYTQYKDIDAKLPRLLNVPGFDGILIHIGNTHPDTDGCILVGVNNTIGRVNNSTATFNKLYPILKSASDKGEEIYITIKD